MRTRPFPFFLALAALACGLTCCSWTSRQKVTEWMDTVPQEAVYDFSGEWLINPAKSTWMISYAPMQLRQMETRIIGTFDAYGILGVVNRERVILFGLREDVVYYTWHLTLVPGAKELVGKQCEGFWPEVGEKKCSNVGFQ